MTTIDDLRRQYDLDGASPREVIQRSIDRILELNPEGTVTANNLLKELVIANQITMRDHRELLVYAVQKYREVNRLY